MRTLWLLVFGAVVTALILAGCSQSSTQAPVAASVPAHYVVHAKKAKGLKAYALRHRRRARTAKAAGGAVSTQHAAIFDAFDPIVDFIIRIGKQGSDFFVATDPFAVENTKVIQEVEIANIPPGQREVDIFGRDAQGNVVAELNLLVTFVAGAIASNDVELNESEVIDVTPPPPSPTGIPLPTLPPSPLVVVEQGAQNIALIDPVAGTRTLLANVPASGLQDVCVDRLNIDLIVTDAANTKVYRFSSTVPATLTTSATFPGPVFGVGQNGNGDFLVASTNQVVLENNAFTTQTPGFKSPSAMAVLRPLVVDFSGSALYFGDAGGVTTPTLYFTSALAAGGTITSIRTFTPPNSPAGIGVLPNGHLAVAEGTANTVYELDQSTNTVIGTPVALAGPPGFITVDPATGHVIVPLPTQDQLVDVNLATGTVTTIFTFASGTTPSGVCVAP